MDALPLEPARLLPHEGDMVLIDKVLHWDETRIVCSADSHWSAHNPLRDRGRLSVYAGVEYAAQAMAAHARLTGSADGAPRRGILAVASHVEAWIDTLDQTSDSLQIEVLLMARDDSNSMYQFRICAQGESLLEGQLTAVLESTGETS